MLDTTVPAAAPPAEYLKRRVPREPAEVGRRKGAFRSKTAENGLNERTGPTVKPLRRVWKVRIVPEWSWSSANSAWGNREHI